ncbi:helix-turn-helix transcriptional regulator [uncultured Ruminococcus sp.]|uniref:helix-turn-helix domain-containing protein n=1 Tax=uncultured Ruminococcus sp. TaxID=165186 RepID=UPI0025CC681D|nr:helix-turn-helix transcriptional regulator [uncultured Ruminococcus sp.]
MIGLRYIMQLEGLYTADVADRLGVNRALISQWQTGKRLIPNKRISELASIFPKYPAYYLTKELTDEDMKDLRQIKGSGKVVTSKSKDERLNKVESIIKEQLAENSKVLSDVAEIMQIGDITSLIKNSSSISDKQLLTSFFSLLSYSQQSYLHDYIILNKLELLKRNADVHGIKKIKFSVISVAMSALAVAFGFDDDISALAVPNSLWASLPPETMENIPNIKQYSEWRDRLVAVLKDIIDYCEGMQSQINKPNAQLQERKKFSQN